MFNMWLAGTTNEPIYVRFWVANAQMIATIVPYLVKCSLACGNPEYRSMLALMRLVVYASLRTTCVRLRPLTLHNTARLRGVMILLHNLTLTPYCREWGLPSGGMKSAVGTQLFNPNTIASARPRTTSDEGVFHWFSSPPDYGNISRLVLTSDTVYLCLVIAILRPSRLVI